MVKCNNCKKDVEYTLEGLCSECFRVANIRAEADGYPLKTVSLLKEILEELKSIKNILEYLK